MLQTGVTAYAALDAELTKREKKNLAVCKIDRNTYARRGIDEIDGSPVILVKLHDTDVVKAFENGAVQFYSGGWKTPTTMDRINTYMPEPYRLSQRDHQWIIWQWIKYEEVNEKGWSGYQETIGYFQEGTLITADGTLCNVQTIQKDDPNKAQLKAIDKYVKGYMLALQKGKISPPSGGDCWLCKGFFGAVGNTESDQQHITEHFKEPYYVPQLLLNARKWSLDAKGWALSGASEDYIRALWSPIGTEGRSDSIRLWGAFALTHIEKLLKNYLRFVFNMAN